MTIREKPRQASPKRPRISPADKALSALMAWNMARHVQNGLRAARSSHKCEYEERGEPDVGDLGVAPCYMGANDEGSWCPSCKAREPIHAQLMASRRVLASLRGKLQRAADRAVAELEERALAAERELSTLRARTEQEDTRLAPPERVINPDQRIDHRER